jgi:SAM-dependent methyltransferase
MAGLDIPLLTLDVGGGTGLNRNLLPAPCVYVCLDNNWVKLLGLLRSRPDAVALFADAAHIPVQNDTVDWVLCTFVSHHLSNDLLVQMFAESNRILKSHGRFIFHPLWNANRRVGKLLWKYDRGSYPRLISVL